MTRTSATKALAQLAKQEPSSDLIVQDIEREHEQASSHRRMQLEHAVACGRLLLKAQADVTGTWGEWVRANLSFGERQAEKYMRLARQSRVQPELVKSGSTLDGALKLVSTPAPEREPTASARRSETSKATRAPSRSKSFDAAQWITNGVGITPKRLRSHVAKLPEDGKKQCLYSLTIIRNVIDDVIREQTKQADEKTDESVV